MGRFLDTSILVPVFTASHTHHEASIRLYRSCSIHEDYCAAHSLAETYSTLTRLPYAQRATPAQARACIENIASKLQLISLDGQEYVAALQEAEQRNISGGTIYDALIAACALKSGAAELFTWNTKHFQLLGPHVSSRLKVPA